MEMVQFSDYRHLVFQGDCADRGIEVPVSNSPVGEFYRSFGGFCVVLDLSGGNDLAFFSVIRNRESPPFMKHSLCCYFSSSAKCFRYCR